MYNLHSLINWKWQNLILLTLIWQGLQAQVTQALRTVKTRRRYGLTGTALQNNMTELWSILDWSVRWWIKPNINTFSLSLSLMKILWQSWKRNYMKKSHTSSSFLQYDRWAMGMGCIGPVSAERIHTCINILYSVWL